MNDTGTSKPKSKQVLVAEDLHLRLAIRAAETRRDIKDLVEAGAEWVLEQTRNDRAAS
jgi:hypothetical protein